MQLNGATKGNGQFMSFWVMGEDALSPEPDLLSEEFQLLLWPAELSSRKTGAALVNPRLVACQAKEISHLLGEDALPFHAAVEIRIVEFARADGADAV